MMANSRMGQGQHHADGPQQWMEMASWVMLCCKSSLGLDVAGIVAHQRAGLVPSKNRTGWRLHGVEQPARSCLMMMALHSSISRFSR